MNNETTLRATSALLPENCLAPRLIVFERTGRWAVALRRELSDRLSSSQEIRIWETRGMEACRRMLSESPSALVVAEATRANIEELLAYVAQWSREFPASRIAVVTERSLAPYEAILRETAAVHVVYSTRQLREVAGLAIQHLRRAAMPLRTIHEQIWDDLPWG